MDIIKVDNLNFSYEEDTPTIQDVSFRIKKGTYTSIVGHNGSGKSTIAKLLIGLMEAKSGTITINDIELSEDTIYEVRNHIGVVFQNPDNQFIGSTVADDIAFGLENKQVESSKMQSIIETYAKKVGMEEYLDKEPSRLSGGQKQRVAIAGILALDLDIIILDEATSMLDPKGKEEINTLVDTLRKEKNLTIISITHDMEEVLKSDHVIVLDGGQIKMAGNAEAILDRAEELKELQLDVPFVYKVEETLSTLGVKVKHQTTMEGMVDAIWQYNSKK